MKIISLFCFVTVSFFSQAQSAADSIRKSYFKEIIDTLADDTMHGRATGSMDETKSFEFIAKIVRRDTQKKLKEQCFVIQTSDSTALDSKNGFVYLNNHSKETILIGAHYDHIGFGGALSLSRKDDEVHNGADDNASGVALALALLYDLSTTKSNKNYLFVFYSGHEIGLYGSTAFAEFVASKRKFKNISTVINFDMVGRMDATMKRLKCMSSLPNDSIVEMPEINKSGLNVVLADEEKLALLDTKPFHLKGIPCLNFTTGIHDDYHATTDDAKYISYEGMLLINSYMRELIERLESY